MIRTHASEETGLAGPRVNHSAKVSWLKGLFQILKYITLFNALTYENALQLMSCINGFM